MARFTDPTYLREEQYKTPSNLTARADLHKRFSTAPGSWQGWVMEQLALRPGERVLEVGGGPGWLWRENAVCELRRVLAAGGRLCATTFGAGHLKELNTMLHDFDPGFPSPDQLALAILPRLENAHEWLGPDFSKIEVVRRDDSLWVTEARPLVDYAFSMSSAAGRLARNRAGELEVFFQDRIDADGGIHISKAAGVVLAWAD
jgi:hypothetical protein